MPSLEPLHSTSLWTSRAIPPRKQQASCRTHRPPSLTVRRLSAQDVPTCYYSSSLPDSYNLVISKLRTSGFTPVLVSLQQGAQRTTCLGFSCTPALFAASPSQWLLQAARKAFNWDAEPIPCFSNQRLWPQILWSAKPLLHLFPILSFWRKQTEQMFLLPTRWVGVKINSYARWLPNVYKYLRWGVVCLFIKFRINRLGPLPKLMKQLPG